MTPEHQKELDKLREDLKRDPKVRIGASVLRDYQRERMLDGAGVGKTLIVTEQELRDAERDIWRNRPPGRLGAIHAVEQIVALKKQPPTPSLSLKAPECLVCSTTIAAALCSKSPTTAVSSWRVKPA